MPVHDGYDVRAFSNDRVSAASCSITGRVRPANEDNYGYLKDSVITNVVNCNPDCPVITVDRENGLDNVLTSNLLTVGKN